MRILVISDTHIPIAKEYLPDIIKKEAEKSNCCIHAGDFIAYEVFEVLSNLTKVYAVCGNMDNSSVINKLPRKQIFKLEDLKIGLIHGRGDPSSLINYINQEFLEEFEEINLFIFGHSHMPYDREHKGKIYFNPGSPTDKIFAPFCSYGILEIEGKKIIRRILKIE